MAATEVSPPQSFWARAIAAVDLNQWFGYAVLVAYSIANVWFAIKGGTYGWKVGKNDPYPLFDVFARTGGALLNLNCALVLVVAARVSITALRGTVLNRIVPFGKAMPTFHSIIGNVIIVATIVHVVFQAANYIAFNLLLNSPSDRTGLTTFPALLITGCTLTVTVLAMRITALPCTRRKNWELFMGVHQVGFVIFFVVLMMHGFHNKVPMTFKYVIGPFVFYLIDRLVGYFRTSYSSHLIERDDIECLGDNAVCLRVPRTFNCIPGQYAEVKVPHISTFQWHPFNIKSSSDDSEISFYIRNIGDWTNSLFELARSDALPQELWVHVRGPFGVSTQKATAHNSAGRKGYSLVSG